MLQLYDAILVDLDQYISKEWRGFDLFWSAFCIERPMLPSLGGRGSYIGMLHFTNCFTDNFQNAHECNSSFHSMYPYSFVDAIARDCGLGHARLGSQ